MLAGKNIVLGVTGGIAAYKSADLVSRLRKKDANVYVIMTKHATEFVTPLTFQTMSQNYVVTDMFESPKTWDVEHIALAKKADVFLIAPASANVIGKLTHGLADDMLTTTAMATRADLILAPAMNSNMYENPVVQENMKKLADRGVRFIEPGAGRLACGDVGSGKMAEPQDMVAYLEAYFESKENAQVENQPLKGKKILVTAGPTVEPIDPFRCVTNHSSGKMGYALAEEARDMGAEVILVSGPVSMTPPTGMETIKITTALDMLEAVMSKQADCDVVIKAAAVSDFRPKAPSQEKIKKKDAEMTIELERNPDILKTLGAHKGNKILVGFAAETHDILAYAQKKLIEKNLDLIVSNDISVTDSGFKSDNNTITIIDKDLQVVSYDKMSKKQAARVILDRVVTLVVKE